MIETLGGMVHRLRAEKGLTLEAVARAIGTSKAYVSLLEKDRSGISLENAGKLALVLGCDAAAIIDLQDAARGEHTEPWLRYLVSRHKPSDYVVAMCRKFILDSGLPKTIPGETADEFRARWDGFYAMVKGVLDNPNIRIFADADVQRVLRHLGLAGCSSWVAIRNRVREIIAERLGDGGSCSSVSAWRATVARTLGIQVITLDKARISAQMIQALTSGASQDVIAGMTMVAASPPLLGAVYRLKDAEARYCLVEDATGGKAAHVGRAFWHEVARTLVDPELALGRGCEQLPDATEEAPFDFLLTRIAGWLALHFAKGQAALAKIGQAKEILPSDLAKAHRQLAAELPPRFFTGAALDALARPLVYLHCYPRLREAQCRERNIASSDEAGMRADPAARLRIAHVFANVVAAAGDVNMRLMLEVPPTSPIAASRKRCCARTGIEDLASWGERYALSGRVRTAALCTKAARDDVHAILEVL
ncbi:MAG: helix-turn-helix domain-containing protein [Kiritimatiellae bacterium]|nr:helix-turn-helix domain-containing protein [Kiritimatiellia bacterium]